MYFNTIHNILRKQIISGTQCLSHAMFDILRNIRAREYMARAYDTTQGPRPFGSHPCFPRPSTGKRDTTTITFIFDIVLITASK